MSVKIRLMRFGRKGAPFYRVVVVDSRRKAVGSYIEKIGTYDPLLKSNNLVIAKDRFDLWMTRGAQLSEGIMKMMKFEESKKSESETPVKKEGKVEKVTKTEETIVTGQ